MDSFSLLFTTFPAGFATTLILFLGGNFATTNFSGQQYVNEPDNSQLYVGGELTRDLALYILKERAKALCIFELESGMMHNLNEIRRSNGQRLIQFLSSLYKCAPTNDRAKAVHSTCSKVCNPGLSH
jgi:hypothetical protein